MPGCGSHWWTFPPLCVLCRHVMTFVNATEAELRTTHKRLCFCAATVKVIVVGNGQVGKTSMSTRYCKGRWTDTYKKTIGVDFMEKRIEVEDLGESVCLMVWDTAGQEEFDSLTSRYYKGKAPPLLLVVCLHPGTHVSFLLWLVDVHPQVRVPRCWCSPLWIVRRSMRCHRGGRR